MRMHSHLLRRHVRLELSFELQEHFLLRQRGEGLDGHSLFPSMRRQHSRKNFAKRALPDLLREVVLVHAGADAFCTNLL